MKITLFITGCLIIVIIIFLLTRRETLRPWENVSVMTFESGFSLIVTELSDVEKKIAEIAVEQAKKDVTGFDSENLAHVKIEKIDNNYFYVYLFATPAVILRGQRFSTAIELQIKTTADNTSNPQFEALFTGWSDEITVSDIYPKNIEFTNSVYGKPFPFFRPTDETRKILNLVDYILKNDSSSKEHITLSEGLARLNATRHIYISQFEPSNSADEPHLFRFSAKLYADRKTYLVAIIDLDKKVVVKSWLVKTPPLLI